MKTKTTISIPCTFAFLAPLILITTLALTISFCAPVTSAFADEAPSSTTQNASDTSSVDSSASQDYSLSDSEQPMVQLPLMGNDYVWFGNNLLLKGTGVENDIVAAGRTITLENCDVAGDMRVAAQEIDIENSSAFENITAAAETIRIKGTRANAVAGASNKFAFSGSCSTLIAHANTVYLDGTIDGDVEIDASKVEIGANTQISGTLYVNSPQSPVIPHEAEIANVEFTQSEESAPIGNVGGILMSFITAFSLFFAIFGLLCTLIVALFAEWFFKHQTAGAAKMLRNRTGAHIGTGIIGALIAPICIIVLCCFVITLPIAGALTLALLAITLVSGGFAGASLFKLVFPRMGRFLCALLGAAIIGIASAIPILGSLVNIAAFMYLLGYVLQSIFLGMRKRIPNNTAPTSTPTTPPAPTAPGTPTTPASIPAPIPAPSPTIPPHSAPISASTPVSTPTPMPASAPVTAPVSAPVTAPISAPVTAPISAPATNAPESIVEREQY